MSQHYGYQPSGYDNQPPHPYPAQYALPPKRRKVWPWVLLAVVVVPIIAFAGCMALVGGAVSAVDDARKGGTVNLGETFTYKSGLAIAVATPRQFKPANMFEVASSEVAYESPITITNGTKQAVGVALITKNATINGQPAQEVFGEATFATQDIAPGQALTLPFRFKTKKGAAGPLQIAVRDTFNEPVFFNGKIG